MRENSELLERLHRPLDLPEGPQRLQFAFRVDAVDENAFGIDLVAGDDCSDRADVTFSLPHTSESFTMNSSESVFAIVMS